MTRHLNVALRMALVTAVLLGLALSARRHGHRAGRVPRRGRRQPGQGATAASSARASSRRPSPAPGTSTRGPPRRATATTPWRRRCSNLGPDQPDAHRPRQRRTSQTAIARQPGPEDGHGPGGHGHHIGQRARPGHHRRQRARAGAACGASARSMSTADVLKLVDARARGGRTFGFLGEPRVNVLELNLALDAAQGAPSTAAAGTP